MDTDLAHCEHRLPFLAWRRSGIRAAPQLWSGPGLRHRSRPRPALRPPDGARGQLTRAVMSWVGMRSVARGRCAAQTAAAAASRARRLALSSAARPDVLGSLLLRDVGRVRRALKVFFSDVVGIAVVVAHVPAAATHAHLALLSCRHLFVRCLSDVSWRKPISSRCVRADVSGPPSDARQQQARALASVHAHHALLGVPAHSNVFS
jgi:hypothetical protein